MRALLVLPVLLVAAPGCLAPQEPAGPDLIGFCPQWEDGAPVPNEAVDLSAEPGRDGNATRHQAANATLRGWPLNRFRVVVQELEVSGGVLELRAFVSDDRSQRNWYDYRSAGNPFSSVAVLNFRSGEDVTGHEFDTLLTTVAQSDPGQGGPIDLEWTLSVEAGAAPASARVVYTVTPGYRVCGAASGALP